MSARKNEITPQVAEFSHDSPNYSAYRWRGVPLGEPRCCNCLCAAEDSTGPCSGEDQACVLVCLFFGFCFFFPQYTESLFFFELLFSCFFFGFFPLNVANSVLPRDSFSSYADTRSTRRWPVRTRTCRATPAAISAAGAFASTAPSSDERCLHSRRPSPTTSSTASIRSA
jgi:hypothetical protein